MKEWVTCPRCDGTCGRVINRGTPEETWEECKWCEGDGGWMEESTKWTDKDKV